jgi:DNA-binding protein H-NS
MDIHNKDIMREPVRRLSLKVIERQIEALKVKAEKLKKRDKKPALREIVHLMQKHDISLGDLGGVTGVRRRGPKPGSRGKVKPMYRNAKTGETWSGRGRTARWLAAAEKAGHKRTEFLIKKT